VLIRLSTRSQLEGRLWLEFAQARTFDADDRTFVVAAARQTAFALERALLFADTREVALELQRSLLGTPPPQDDRFDVASLYRPAGSRLEVGGDWHDVFTLPSGRVGVVVGDVVGRGLAAASAMGQLRSAVRALAGAGLSPADVLADLDVFVGQVEAARYATVAIAEVDAGTGAVSFASGGHLPPALVGAEGAPRLFQGGRSTPLGIPIPGVPRPQGTFTLEAGDGFVLYTDGLVERRREPIDAGIDRLLAAIAACEDRSPERLVDVVPQVLPAAGEDDVCMLAFRRR
jgi:serine phosphatase RsbU (regulator of sigma subunit)